MLVLTRKQRQEIRIGEHITVTILRIKGQQVRIGVEAPADVKVLRGELSPLPAPEPSDDDRPAQTQRPEIPTGQALLGLRRRRFGGSTLGGRLRRWETSLS